MYGMCQGDILQIQIHQIGEQKSMSWSITQAWENPDSKNRRGNPCDSEIFPHRFVWKYGIPHSQWFIIFPIRKAIGGIHHV